MSSSLVLSNALNSPLDPMAGHFHVVHLSLRQPETHRPPPARPSATIPTMATQQLCLRPNAVEPVTPLALSVHCPNRQPLASALLATSAAALLKEQVGQAGGTRPSRALGRCKACL